MKPLRERNQAAVGAVTLVLIALVTLTAYYSDELPLLGEGTTYSAYFAESANLAAGDEVQVAGVKVGEVDEVLLDGDRVLVTFRVAGVEVGARTRAAIEVKTLLGEKLLALRPEGERPQDPNDPIPLARTTTPYEIQDAFTELSDTVGEIDTDQLAESFDVIADSMADTPPHLTDALNGLSALAETVSSRDEELARLLSHSSGVSKTLAERNDQLRMVIEDGNLLLTELQNRERAIDSLLTGTKRLSEQLSGFVADNEETLRPTLEQLGEITDMLSRNQDNLNRSLELLAPFTRVGTNATGNGRWFEGYICGLLPPVITAAGAKINPEGCTPPVAAPNQAAGGN